MGGTDRTGGPVVAIDGPSGSGKSTVSRRLAQALGASYLDTGAMYRAATWAVLQAGADPADPATVVKITRELSLQVGTDPAQPRISVDGVDVAAAIRGPDVTAAVSVVAAVPQVREHLVALQREIIRSARTSGGIVVEGRDIGAVVAPDARLKVFLTASVPERARRRSSEQAADPGATAVDLARRDHLDSTRAASPLARADGAVILDTTDLSVDEVVARMVDLLRQRMPS